MGPTASGKTGLAEALADRLDAQLINADAFQMYRGMDIGTAKPAAKHRYEMLDILNPNESFGVGKFARMASEILQRSFEQNRSCVMVGGTGLYIRAVFEEYDDLASKPDPELRAALERRQESEGLEALYTELTLRAPEAAAKTDPKNPARVRRALERLYTGSLTNLIKLPSFRKIKLGITTESADLSKIIESRTESMIKMGWLEEIEMLSMEGYGPDDPGFRAIGYRPFWDYLNGKINLEEATASTNAATRQYAKRQRTWLRSEPGLQMLPQETKSGILERAWGAIGASDEGA